MRIGIITLSASDNCGSLLQCYALKRLLEHYGNVEVINFSSLRSHQMYDYYYSRLSISNSITYIREWFYNRYYLTLRIAEKRCYDRFRMKYLEIKGKELFNGDLPSIGDRFDVVVTGSDQVWNVKMYDFDEAFLLGWTSSHRIAFAPSLGGHDIKESPDWEKYHRWLCGFDLLSVREEKGKECLERLMGFPVKKVLDPTLCLPHEEWVKLIGKPIIKSKYYFYYSWAYDSDILMEIVKAESEKNKTPVVVVDPRKWTRESIRKWSFFISKKQGPIAFLNYMYYAERVYVESFHGIIFSYIFKKDFWLLDTHGNYADMDVRLRELLGLLNMKTRVLTAESVKNTDQSEPVVYTQNASFDDLLLETKSFIKEYFNEKCISNHGS